MPDTPSHELPWYTTQWMWVPARRRWERWVLSPKTTQATTPGKSIAGSKEVVPVRTRRVSMPAYVNNINRGPSALRPAQESARSPARKETAVKAEPQQRSRYDWAKLFGKEKPLKFGDSYFLESLSEARERRHSLHGSSARGGSDDKGGRRKLGKKSKV
ncbi:hypothetical protein EXIGLDRAFT_781489 [Exidia glandulosa HHB12029]|uniref:Uncharacterized protein n=1 Tax=Exidia glandulosa HHB12029 TaxID=1314781 RepID=A0A165B878_EXIGL|nr:hypothetical protein EXIGLDRAFT_781489 [Exidia glandulosa HHB12029]